MLSTFHVLRSIIALWLLVGGKAPVRALIARLMAGQSPATLQALHRSTLAPLQSGTALVSADTDEVLAGQLVTFRWAAHPVKLLASGGSFGPRTALTDEESATVRVWHTTTFEFRVWMLAEPGPNVPAPAHRGLVYTHEALTVSVLAGGFPALATYHSPHGWSIDVVGGWNRYDAPQPNGDDVIDFEPAEDSPERVSVAAVAVGNITAVDLMKEVLADAPNAYDVFTDVHEWPTTQDGLPAAWATFRGLNHRMGGMATESDIVAVVKDGVGYVISCRGRASQAAADQEMWRCLVKSFRFD